MNTLEYIKENQIIAIARGIDPKKIAKVAKALSDGGVYCIEVTFNQKGDLNNTVDSIRSIIALNDSRICVGAGTVCTIGQVELAYNAGAKYIISPDTNPQVIKKTKELGLVSIPGALTPSEITFAHSLGADIVKIFPSGNFGPSYIKAIKAPISHISLAAVGGINIDNILDFKNVGVECFGIGQYIVDNKAIDCDDYKTITNKAKTYCEKLHSVINL